MREIDSDIGDVTGFTLKSEINLDAPRFDVGNLKEFGLRQSAVISGSIWPASRWLDNDFQMVVREPIVLPWYRALWHRARHIPIPTVEAIKFTGTPTRQQTTLDDDETEMAVEFTARDVVFTAVPDYSWWTKARLLWLRLRYRLLK